MHSTHIDIYNLVQLSSFCFRTNKKQVEPGLDSLFADQHSVWNRGHYYSLYRPFFWIFDALFHIHLLSYCGGSHPALRPAGGQSPASVDAEDESFSAVALTRECAMVRAMTVRFRFSPRRP